MSWPCFWSQALDATAWRRIDVRDGAKSPLVVEIVKRRVVSRTHRRQQGAEELLAVMRYRDRDQDEVVKVDYYLSNAVPETLLWELARVAKAEHRIEECLQRSRHWFRVMQSNMCSAFKPTVSPLLTPG